MFDENNNIIPENEDGQEVTPPVYAPSPFVPPFYYEKRTMRRTALGVGIPCICLTLIGFVWSAVYLFFTVNVAKMSYSQAVELSQNPAVQQILQIMLSALMFLVPFGISAKCMGLRIDKTIDFGKANKGTALPFLLLGIGFCAFFNIALSYVSSWFDSFGIDYEVDFGKNPSGIFGFLLTLAATAIVPALVEEFACRGIVIGLLKKYGEGFAIITSSVVFGIMHGNFEQIPFAIMVGLVLGYIYIKTKSIWVCVALHGANNAISVIFSYLEGFASTNLQNLLYIVYLIAALLAAISGVFLLAKNGSEAYEIKENNDIGITKKQKYTWFFTSWSIILFIIFNFVEALSYFVI